MSACSNTFSSVKAFTHFVNQQGTTVEVFMSKYPSRTGKPPTAVYFNKLQKKETTNFTTYENCAKLFNVSIHEFLAAGWINTKH